ncbi:uncharacterized protein TrAtP1_010050 [Trichoderma atroviride]|uniref:uncharacterized protein n=1 Tax=Hypocrea atroviridis TaxID=63577 RepID=UPI0033308043|nr:hypothetical protein TrAtP1_010050 [Trichoderma atroviride]
MSNNVRSQLGFLKRDELYDSIRPYSCRYTPHDGTPRHNLTVEMVDITIHDARPLDPTIDEMGFTLTSYPTEMAYGDYNDSEKISNIYVPELEEHLRTLFQAPHVKVIDYAVRRRHPTFPISTGSEYADQQPARLVHLGASPQLFRLH